MNKQTTPCRKAFTQTLLELAQDDADITALATDSRGSVTLGEFAKALPSQFVEVGIAEQDAVGIGAGLALSGKKPFVCGPACFLAARSLEQIKLDMAYSGANVKIIGVSGGVSYGALGSSHHSLQDIAVMRAIPGISVVLPCDVRQTQKLTRALAAYEGPVYVRMGRGAVPDVYADENFEFEIGRASLLRDGGDITIIGTGETVYHALSAASLLEKAGIKARVLDMHTLKPFDTQAVIAAARETGAIVTVEEHSVNGGLGAAVANTVVENCPVRMKIIGIPDTPIITGNSAEVFDCYGLTAEKISDAAVRLLNAAV
jgi:transketolase